MDMQSEVNDNINITSPSQATIMINEDKNLNANIASSSIKGMDIVVDYNKFLESGRELVEQFKVIKFISFNNSI